MKITLDNINYCASVVNLKTFVDLPNCDNVKAAILFGNSVIVSKDAKEGDIGIYFPLECAISKEFLGANNLYRKFEFGNKDTTKTGFFEQHGRVKCCKFRGNKSEGFFIGIETLNFLGFTTTDFTVGMNFNKLDDIEICKKYVIERNIPTEKKPVKSKTPRFTDIIVENQFRFHYDTQQFKRNLDKFNDLDTIVSISNKWHGTSSVNSHILTNRNLNWYEKLLVKFGIKLNIKQYAVVAASRKVIKSVDEITKGNEQHFYKEDIWTIVKDEIKDRIPKGFTVYGEIVGYVPSGGAIQSLKGNAYHYGCSEKEHKFIVYRITFTNEDGKVIELYWNQMKSFCVKYGFTHVVEHFYGTIGEFIESNNKGIRFGLTNNTNEVSEKFLELLSDKYLEKMCPYNNNKVPAEGVVIRIDSLEESQAFKLKSFLFLKGESEELDKGIIDTETMES